MSQSTQDMHQLRKPSPAIPLVATPFAWDALTQSIAVLGITCASIALFAQQLSMGNLAVFIEHNTLSPPSRTLFAGTVLAAGAIPVLLVGIALAISRGRLAGAIRRTSDIFCPLAVTGLLPSLFLAKLWHNKPLPYLLVLVATGLLTEQLLRRSLAAFPSIFQEWGSAAALRIPPKLRRWAPLILVLLAATFYSLYMGYYSILNHRRFGTSSFDLGIYDNLMYTAMRGEPFLSRVLYGPDGGNYIAGHAEYILVLFVPFYAIRPGAETILVFQAVLLGFAALPLYLFASTKIPRSAAAFLAICYLLFAPLHGPQFYDFHWLPLAIFFHFWLYWAIATRRTLVGVLMVLILFSIREDIAIGLAMLGVFLLITGARPKAGVALTLSSVLWFALNKFVIMPWAGQWWFANLYKDLIANGEHGYGSIVKTLIVNPVYVSGTLATPDKLAYALHMLGPLLLLPVRRWHVVLLLAPAAFFTLFTTDYGPTISIAFQYTTHWIPYLFAGTVWTLHSLSQGDGGSIRRWAAIGAMGLSLTSHSYVFGAILQRGVFVGGFSHIPFVRSPEERARYEELQTIKALIPQNASVAATDNEVPHLSNRMITYSLRLHHGDADYLVIFRNGIGFGETRKFIQTAIDRNPYQVIHDGANYVAFRRGSDSPETVLALQKIGIKKGTPQ